jgi:hypothetical protein
MDTEWVSAGLAPNEFTATLWRNILADAGIDAYLKPTEAATFLVAAAILPVRVMVHKDKLDEAKALLADIEIVDQDPGEPDE